MLPATSEVVLTDPSPLAWLHDSSHFYFLEDVPGNWLSSLIHMKGGFLRGCWEFVKSDSCVIADTGNGEETVT